MRKLLLFCSLFLLGMACSQDDSLTATVDPVPEGGRNANPYAVTVEEALTNLNQALAEIDGETRTGAMRRAVSVDRVKAANVCDLTRSDVALDVEDLFYIVSFGEGNGSAVLGADKRITPILAILDETVLATDDFGKFDTRATSLEELTPKEDLQNMLTNMLVATAEVDLASFDEDVVGPLPMIGKETTYTYEKQGPHLNTKWSQEAPFNNSCPCKTNSTILHKPAGCVPIGVGQLLRFYEYPSPNMVNGVLYDWDLIGQLDYGVTASNPTLAQDITADYIYEIGTMMDANYGDLVTTVSHSNRDVFLRSIGYASARAVPWDASIAENILWVQKEPLGTRGNCAGSSVGHFWVLDGWMNVIKNVWRLVKEYGAVLPERTLISSTLDSQLVHCNYGWGGAYDGYYTPCAYDLSAQRTGVYIEDESGDLVGSSTDNYNYNIEIILLE